MLFPLRKIDFLQDLLDFLHLIDNTLFLFIITLHNNEVLAMSVFLLLQLHLLFFLFFPSLGDNLSSAYFGLKNIGLGLGLARVEGFLGSSCIVHFPAYINKIVFIIRVFFYKSWFLQKIGRIDLFIFFLGVNLNAINASRCEPDVLNIRRIEIFKSYCKPKKCLIFRNYLGRAESSSKVELESVALTISFNSLLMLFKS